MCNTVKTALYDCKELVNDIMNEITTILEQKKIKFEKTTDFEIVVENKKKKEIKDLIENKIDLSGADILLQISEINDTTFIRLKFS
jgi:hypothetical protein